MDAGIAIIPLLLVGQIFGGDSAAPTEALSGPPTVASPTVTAPTLLSSPTVIAPATIAETPAVTLPLATIPSETLLPYKPVAVTAPSNTVAPIQSNEVRAITTETNVQPESFVPSTTTTSPYSSATPVTSVPVRTESSANTGSSKDWMRRFVTQPQHNGLIGEPVTLQEAMRGVRGHVKQIRMIGAYWNLSKKVASYNVAVSLEQRLQNRLTGSTIPGEGKYRAEIKLNTAQKKLAAIKAQADFAVSLYWKADKLPLPVSEPHVGSYRTRYEEIFANRRESKALRLHYLLPAQSELITAYVAVLNAKSATSSSDPFALLALRDESEKFLTAIYDYNADIAQYALLAVQDGMDGADIVPMLIKVNRPNRSEVEIARTSAVEDIPVREPRTFNAQSLDGPVEEHSVLVKGKERSGFQSSNGSTRVEGPNRAVAPSARSTRERTNWTPRRP